MTVGGQTATANYTTPPLTLSNERGTFERSWLDDVIVSPYLAVFIVVSVLALLALGAPHGASTSATARSDAGWRST